MAHEESKLPTYEEVSAFLYEVGGKIYNRVSRGSNAPMDGESGTIDSHNYRVVRLFGVNYKTHRLVWLLNHKRWPKDQVDHINHDRIDNRIENLREVGFLENSKNVPLRKDNVSGVVGVRWYDRYGKWHSQIAVKGKSIHLGYFLDKFEAMCTRKSAEIEYGFHENHGARR